MSMKWKRPVMAIGLFVLGLFAMSTAFADNKARIEANVSETLTQFYAQHAKNKDLAGKAKGMLIFPKITKGGVGVGGAYGQGVLQVDGKTVGYYTITSGSVGLTLGMASRSEIIMFMTQESLDKFTASNGWKVGVDAGVALVSLGTGGQYDTETLQQPILGFVFGEKGLIGDLSFQGSKITKNEV